MTKVTTKPATQKSEAPGLTKLGLDDSISLNTALSNKGLKARHVGADNYMRVLTLKTTLRNALKTVDEAYRDLAEEFEMDEVGPGQYVHKAQDKVTQTAFSKKIVEVGRKWKSPGLDLNFLPEGELREFCKDQDVETESILFEHLLKSEAK